MKIQPTITVYCLLLLASPIAALAADATAPTAPAVQSAAWTTADYLRAALSGAAGGVLSLVGMLLVTFINNRHARKTQRDAHTYQLAQLAYIEMKDVCRKYITMMSEDNISTGKFNKHEISIHLDMIMLYTNNDFYNIALSLFQFLIEHEIDLLRCNTTNAHGDAIASYRAKYEILLNHTKNLLRAQ